MEDNPAHNVDDLVFNFSSHTLTDAQKSILCKGLNFALPPKKLRYEDYFLNFELLFKNSKDSESLKDGEIDEFKSKLRTIAYTSLKSITARKRNLKI